MLRGNSLMDEKQDLEYLYALIKQMTIEELEYFKEVLEKIINQQK